MKKLNALLLIAAMLLSMGVCAFAEAVPVFLQGDVSGDGKVQSEDARLALRASVGLEMYDEKSIEYMAADTDRDGQIAPEDARSILRASVGLEELCSDTEFDYLRNDNFYLKGTMTDASGLQSPLEMAVTSKSVYLLSVFEGISIGILVNDDKAYMIYPEKECYLVLSSVVLKALGLSTEELVRSVDLDYSQYDLSKADAVIGDYVNDALCKVYIFRTSYGDLRFFMNGYKLLRFAAYDANGTPDTVNDIDFLTDQVPADKIDPPKNYKKYSGLVGLAGFFGQMDLSI